MTSAGVGTLLVLGFWVAVVLFLVLLVAPQLATSRLVLELSKVRSALTEMSLDEPEIGNHPDVQRLDWLLSRTIAMGRPPGLSMMLAAAVTVSGGQRRHDPAYTAPMFRGLSSSQRVALYLLRNRVTLEVVRATFMASRLWFLAWPGWLLIRFTVRRTETLQRDAEDGTQLSRVVAAGSGLDDRRLQVA